MPETQPATKPAKNVGGVREFTVEFGDEKNRSILINVFRIIVRGNFSLRKFFETEGGSRNVGDAMQSVPDIPGLFMRVSPKDLKAYLYDPWEGEKHKDKWDRLNASMRNALAAKGGDFGPVKRNEFTLTEDTLKTLVLELVAKVKDGKCKVVKGSLPSDAEIESLSGRELFDPMNSGRKPRYCDQVEEWERRLDAGA